MTLIQVQQVGIQCLLECLSMCLVFCLFLTHEIIWPKSQNNTKVPDSSIGSTSIRDQSKGML